ncbi:ethylene-overproduction protein 1 [Malania oleifera]|uniref:ethylene-overproduction protein 1 n=1 Tax=Malania oleifera TaxID=397392 RepID=UPI0025AEB0E3|nr:ethylene-overproduction protein 1 [Malania oleifera]
MRGFKLLDRCKGAQVHALNSSDTASSAVDGGGGSNGGKLNRYRRRSCSSRQDDLGNNSIASSETLFPCGLPTAGRMEPPMEPQLKPVNFVETLADLYHRLEACSGPEKSAIYLEQYAFLYSLRDPKLLRRCLQSARQHAADVLSKVVLSAWLGFERREHEHGGSSSSSMVCSGYVLECPRAALLPGYDPNSVNDRCQCCQSPRVATHLGVSIGDEGLAPEVESDVCFCIEDEEINCVRDKIAALSSPFKAMLCGNFAESKRKKIDFSENGVSAEGMRALDVFSRTRRLDFFSTEIVLELLYLANRFCCDELKSGCDAHLASLVFNTEDALVLINYSLEQTASLTVASCLQVLLRELPRCFHNLKVVKLLCSSETRERLGMSRHASFLLYYFLSQVAMEEKMSLATTMSLLERLGECATERWQKELAFHQLGCTMLERKEYEGAQCCFEAAADAGHVYSMAGVARCKYKQGLRYSACKLMNSLINKYKLVGWMYQERSLYIDGRERILDLNTASELDPTLSFPYKYRAVVMVEEKEIEAAILEINKIIGFKLSPDCLELRAWFFIALLDYESALRDVRALLSLEPNYMTFHGKVSGDQLVELLSHHVQAWSQADCWMQLYDRWSSVDDIGSLAVIHQMLANDPGNSLLWFRQSLLLLRLNCQKAAMRSLRLAQSHSGSKHERLVYEGWILYDTGHRDEVLSKADKSICIQRSFEAFFLKAFVLADTSADTESSSYIIKLLEEALRCPSDGLRKGQALNNLGSIYLDCGELDLATDCYRNALDIRHTRAHQGLARIYHRQNQKKDAYDEMTKLIEKAQNSASAYEKRSEYCDRELAMSDLGMVTRLDPTRTYPYRYRAAVLMDDQKETEAVEELTKVIAFKPDLQTLHLRAAFFESMGNVNSALQDCEAALCLDPNHTDSLNLHKRAWEAYVQQQK